MTDTTVIENAPDDTVGQDAGPTIEDRARAMGWKDKADLKDPDRFIDAKTFVERGENILPILQANSRKMEKALEASKAEMADLKKTLDTVSSQLPKLAQREYARALADLEAKLDAAAEIGDVAAVKTTTQAIRELDKDAEAGKKPAVANDAPAGVTDEMRDAWKSERPWFDTDTIMRGAAIEFGNEAFTAGFRGNAWLAEIDKRMRAGFPDKFENPRRKEASAVASPTGARASGGKTFSDLPPEAKAAWRDFERAGVKITQEKYAKDFDWEGYAK